MSDVPDDANQPVKPGLDPRAIGTMPAINARAMIEAALPFQRGPQASTPPVAAPALAIVPGAGLKLPRRPAPKQLGAPGALIPLATFLASGPAPQSGPISQPISGPSPISGDTASARASMPDARLESGPAPAPSGPGAGSPGSLGGSVSGGDSPWPRRAQAPALSTSGNSEAQGASPSSGPAASGAAGDPALAKSSPWLASQSIAADLLPSAAVDIPSAKTPDTPPAPPPAPQASRTGMTVLLALAAVALVAAIAYFAIIAGRRKSDDPADVKAGQAQKDYNMDNAPTASAASTASAAPPKPVVKPPPPKPTKKADIYNDL